MTVRLTVDLKFRGDTELRTYFHDALGKEDIVSNEYWEIAYIYEGEGIASTADGECAISTGRFLFISPNSPYSITSKPKKEGAMARTLRCIFTPEYFKRIWNSYSKTDNIQQYSLYKLLDTKKSFCLNLSDDRRSNIKNLLMLIAHENGHYTTGSHAVTEHAMNALFICISRLYENQINKYVETATDRILNELTSYLKMNFGYKITLDDLANRVHLSREYISRYFRQHTGKTISQYLLEVRIEKAADMLRTTLVPISDIAMYCGYSSISNFQKAFRRVTGQSPSEYRKTHKVITDQG